MGRTIRTIPVGSNGIIKNHVHVYEPRIRKSEKWTDSEMELLIYIKSMVPEFEMDKYLKKYLPDRTSQGCRQKWQKISRRFIVGPLTELELVIIKSCHNKVKLSRIATHLNRHPKDLAAYLEYESNMEFSYITVDGIEYDLIDLTTSAKMPNNIPVPAIVVDY